MDMQEELLRRVELLDKAEKNRELQKVEVELCKRDIMHFFKNYLYTDKNSNLYWPEYPDVIPFIPYPYQEECIKEVWDSIEKGEPVFIEKSRQMGFSWLIMAIFVYGFLFHNHKYLVLSQKQDDVDKKGDMKSLFEKARFMLKNLPDWMLPVGWKGNDTYNKYMSISRPDGTGSITGESANPNASRWGTYKAIFPDEFAFQSNATTINRAMMSASPCRIYTSTPNGKWNEHYRMRELAMAGKIKGLRYHWSDHPLYTQEWYNNKIASMDKVSIAQELEIDYNVAVVWRVYPDFPSEASKEVKYNPNLPLYVTIDNSHGGTDPNAVICIQDNGIYWDIIDAIEVQTNPLDMANYMVGQPKIDLVKVLTANQLAFRDRYVNYDWRRATFIGDPYDTKSALGNSTILDDYRSVGINLVVPMNRNKQEQIRNTSKMLYKFRYNDNCLDMATAILNARYPERKDTSQSTQPIALPIHDWTSHFRTALEYFVTYMLENKPARPSHQVGDYEEKRNMLTGELISQKSLTKDKLRKMGYKVL